MVWLFPSTPYARPGPLGVVPRTRPCHGTITAANLTGALTGRPLSALVDAIVAGNAYVNVHTNDGIGDPGSGPGDLQGGEIRGQLD